MSISYPVFQMMKPELQELSNFFQVTVQAFDHKTASFQYEVLYFPLLPDKSVSVFILEDSSFNLKFSPYS